MASAYTQTDIDSVRGAIVKLAAGTRAVSVQYQGRTVQYQAAQLGELRALLAEMMAEQARAAGAQTYRLAATRRGV